MHFAQVIILHFRILFVVYYFPNSYLNGIAVMKQKLIVIVYKVTYFWYIANVLVDDEFEVCDVDEG